MYWAIPPHEEDVTESQAEFTFNSEFSFSFIGCQTKDHISV